MGDSCVELERKLEARTRELAEALDQQAATAAVLRAISNSPTDVRSALGVIAESAAQLLDVTDAEIMLVEDDALRSVAKHGPIRNWPVGSVRPINRDWVTGRAVLDRVTIHVPDLQAAGSDFPQGAAYARQYGHRTTLATPLLREGNPIGAILIRRMDVRPLTGKQIALLPGSIWKSVGSTKDLKPMTRSRVSFMGRRPRPSSAVGRGLAPRRRAIVVCSGRAQGESVTAASVGRMNRLPAESMQRAGMHSAAKSADLRFDNVSSRYLRCHFTSTAHPRCFRAVFTARCHQARTDFRALTRLE